MSDSKYVNGSIWKAPSPFNHVVVVQYLVDGIFCLLDTSDDGSRTLNILTDPEGGGRWSYIQDELPERLKGWEQLTDYFVGLKDK